MSGYNSGERGGEKRKEHPGQRRRHVQRPWGWEREGTASRSQVTHSLASHVKVLQLSPRETGEPQKGFEQGRDTHWSVFQNLLPDIGCGVISGVQTSFRSQEVCYKQGVKWWWPWKQREGKQIQNTFPRWVVDGSRRGWEKGCGRDSWVSDFSTWLEKRLCDLVVGSVTSSPALGQKPALPVTSSVTLGKWLPLSGPQFSPLKNGDR